VTALAALLLLSLASVAGAEEPPPRGVLEVPESVFDAGKIERGATLRHAFLLKNVGTAELAIDAKPG
jgi:hypothetical protein